MNIQSYIWNNNMDFYLSRNQKEIFNMIKGRNIIGPIHIGGKEGSGKTFLARRLLDENCIYLPIHYDLNKSLITNCNYIILDNIINFHSEILSKIKRSIQRCKLLIIISENSSKSLSTEVKSLIRRNYDLESPDFQELQEFAEYLLDFFKIELQDVPDSVKDFSGLINWIESLLKK